MRWNKISDAVVRRLPVYLRVLDDLARLDEAKLISSHELGVRAGVGPALVRKDLAWFGEFGKQGVGYEIEFLREELRKILNLDGDHPIALVGMGSLGVALARYNIRRYQEDSDFRLRTVALFDSEGSKIGSVCAGIEVLCMDELEQVVVEEGVEMAMITVPADAAQEVADRLVKAGVKAMLNFAPVKINVPEGVHVSSADLTLELQRLAFYLA